MFLKSHEMAGESAAEILSRRVKNLRLNATSALVSDGSLDQRGAQVVRAQECRVAADDDGVSLLGPEDYINKRLVKLLHWYDLQHGSSWLGLRFGFPDLM